MQGEVTFPVGREVGRKLGLDVGGVLVGLHAVHLHGAFVSSARLHLPFKASCNLLKSPAAGLGDFKEGEDQEEHEEAGEDNKHVGS